MMDRKLYTVLRTITIPADNREPPISAILPANRKIEEFRRIDKRGSPTVRITSDAIDALVQKLPFIC